jgi:hypothetical protein
MKRRIYAIPVLLPGLIIAQVIATIQVYLSNTELYRTLQIITDHGYLPVPNERVMPYLKGIPAAFWGGLFFTLSLGAGLSLLSMVAAWGWVRFFRRKRIILALYAIFWLGILIAVNFRGLTLMASTYFLLIPPLVFWVALRGLHPPDQRSVGYGWLIPVAPVFLLAILWIPHVDRDFFGEIRDRLLLSNRFGQKVNQFYYNYTLYAAEVFKSLDQKTLKTCNLEGVRRAPIARALERELGRYDYLPLGDSGTADLQVTETGERFILAHNGIAVIETTLKDLLSRTGPVLKEFSLKSDRQAIFRKVIFLSLLVALPVVLYVFFFDLFRFGFSFFLAARSASPAAALLCLCMGAGLLAGFSLYSSGVIDETHVAQALRSEKLPDRVAALKIVECKSLEIASFAGYDRLLSSPHITERYWLVRTLGVSRQARTYRDLLDFLDDPHLNVVCMAYYALGRRGDRRAVPEILKRIKASRHWYSQWYAYNALKTLGWKQSRRGLSGKKD